MQPNRFNTGSFNNGYGGTGGLGNPSFNQFRGAGNANGFQARQGQNSLRSNPMSEFQPGSGLRGLNQRDLHLIQDAHQA